MKNKLQYIVIALTILAGAPCWPSAGDAFDNVSYDEIAYMASFWDTESLLRLAETNTQYRDLFKDELYNRILKPYNGDPQTALFIAAITNQPYLIKYLLQHGASLEATDEDCSTALMLATINSRYNIVAQLIKAGADVDKINLDGNTALMFATWWNRKQIVEALLDAGANKNLINQYGRTALDIAKDNNNHAIIQMLQN